MLHTCLCMMLKIQRKDQVHIQASFHGWIKFILRNASSEFYATLPSVEILKLVHVQL